MVPSPAGAANESFSPVTPCRLVDTRLAAGPFAAGQKRTYQVTGTGLAGQGGVAGGCAVPATAVAVEVSVSAVAPAANGSLRAWPAGTPEPNATFLNWTARESITNTGTVPIATTAGTLDLTVEVNNGGTHLVVDVQGYFAAPPPVTLAIDAGNNHACALRSNGTVACWGSNANGQLGDGTYTSSNVPVVVTGLSGATAIAAGDNHSCATRSDGTARCWGSNANGQLGNGTYTDSNVPVVVTGLTAAATIAAGRAHSCATRSDGTARCWGSNLNGQLGNDGIYSNFNVPVTVAGLSSATAIAAGGAHSCATRTDGTAHCWGFNYFGQLGDGTNKFDSKVPVTVAGLSGATAIDAGRSHSCATRSDGTARCWGYNANGQLGDGTYTDSNVPVVVTGLTAATAIAAGFYHSCATRSDGTARCWGSSNYGQLGDGTYTSSNVPVTVLGLP